MILVVVEKKKRLKIENLAGCLPRIDIFFIFKCSKEKFKMFGVIISYLSFANKKDLVQEFLLFFAQGYVFSYSEQSSSKKYIFKHISVISLL